MGEYAVRKSDGEQVKIGTCELMYYLRYEDRAKVSQLDGSLDPSKELNLFWRLPFPDEDHQQAGDYEQYNRGLRLYRLEQNGKSIRHFRDETTAEDPGIMQLKHESGLLVNVPCYHGEKLPESGEVKFFWNGKSWFYELAFVKNTPDGVLPVVKCRHCNNMWRYSWDEVLQYIEDHEMVKRLEVYNK